MGHVVRRGLVRVAGGVGVVLGVVEGVVWFFAFGVCAVPQFTHVLCVTVDVVQGGFETVQVFGGGVVVFANILVSFVGDEAGAGAARADGGGRGVVVAGIGGEVGALFVCESVPRVGGCLHGGGGLRRGMRGAWRLLRSCWWWCSWCCFFLAGLFSSCVFIVAYCGRG